MSATKPDIPDIHVFEPRVFEDARGFFFESFNAREFQRVLGFEPRFVQDNLSRSAKGVLRGLHYQIRNPQGKLVRAIAGEIFDVAVDIRRSSKTFRKWTGLRLSAENKLSVWVPEGFAHGYVVLSNHAEVLYKTTDYWAPQHERTIQWNDPELDIRWPLQAAPILGAKDQKGVPLSGAELFP
jgi:dTDP-4-dehydrorhamnose 3,5-epimerase